MTHAQMRAYLVDALVDADGHEDKLRLIELLVLLDIENALHTIAVCLATAKHH
jgi:hypothetical protein